MIMNTNAKINNKMVNLKFKLTLQQANDRIKELAQYIPTAARLDYCLSCKVGTSTMYRYMTGNVTSIVTANHLVDYLERYIKDNKINVAA